MGGEVQAAIWGGLGSGEGTQEAFLKELMSKLRSEELVEIN